MYLKRDDNVIVIAGAHKGSTGKVLRVLRDKNQVIVQGINLRHKHLRRSQQHPQGARIQKEMPIDASNVQLIDPKSVICDAGTCAMSPVSDPSGAPHDAKRRRAASRGPSPRQTSRPKVSRNAV